MKRYFYPEDSYEILVSDGCLTIGYVNNYPACWPGNYSEPNEYAVYSEGMVFGVNCQDEFTVQNYRWVRGEEIF